MGSEKFCLRWNDFETNISSAFRELRDDKDFFDVTLACDDDQIQAHKVILSACSPFFRNILRRNPHQHPLLYLKGVKYTDLQSVLNFMYHGEVNIAQEELNSFLAVAEDLRVKGLTQNQSGGTAKKDPPSYSPPAVKDTREPAPPPKRPRPVTFPSTNNSSLTQKPVDDEIQEVVPVKSEPRDPPPPAPVPHEELYSAHPHPYPQPHVQTSRALAPVDDQTLSYPEENYEEYQYEEEQGTYEGAMMGEMGEEGSKDPLEDLRKHIIRRGPIPECGICYQYSNKSAINVRNHIESKHFPGMFSYKCEWCQKVCSSKQAADKHNLRCTYNVNKA